MNAGLSLPTACHIRQHEQIGPPVNYPITLCLLFLAFVLAVVNWATAHGPTINGAGFLAAVLLVLAMLALWAEHHQHPGAPRR